MGGCYTGVDAVTGGYLSAFLQLEATLLHQQASALTPQTMGCLPPSFSGSKPPWRMCQRWSKPPSMAPGH